MSDRDVTFAIGNGEIEWVVRAFHFDTLDEARRVWSKYEGSTRGGDWSFSVWAVATPAMDDGLVVFCGRLSELPEVAEGQPFSLTRAEAEQFVRRRARASLDAFSGRKEGETYFETRDRYGPENPQKIGEGGALHPYKK